MSSLQVNAHDRVFGTHSRPLVEDCTDPATGEIIPLVVVTDNGPAMKSAADRWFAARSHLAHVRTRHRSPHTNGVVERWIESLKYERLYRHDIASGVELADRVADFINDYNAVPPPGPPLAAAPRRLPTRQSTQTEPAQR